MSQRRLFSPKIIDSDAFLDMPQSSQLLYFHLCMRADDDGFVGNPKKILRMIGGNDDDLKVLTGKRFLLTFESGVIVIKHWRIHNTIRLDRYNETQYIEEKSSLIVKENDSYTEFLPNGNQMATNRIPKLSKVKLRESIPSKEKLFFNNLDEQERVTDEIALKYQIEPLAVKQEIIRFVSYWTEPTQSGHKTRWELQKTFEVSRRLATWFSNVNKFQVNNINKITTL